jgi:hypothetical protein
MVGRCVKFLRLSLCQSYKCQSVAALLQRVSGKFRAVDYFWSARRPEPDRITFFFFLFFFFFNVNAIDFIANSLVYGPLLLPWCLVFETHFSTYKLPNHRCHGLSIQRGLQTQHAAYKKFLPIQLRRAKQPTFFWLFWGFFGHHYTSVGCNNFIENETHSTSSSDNKTNNKKSSIKKAQSK